MESRFKTKYPFEVGLMKTYVALRTNRKRELQRSSFKECQRHDGVNCWIAMQLLNDEDFEKLFQKKGSIIPSSFSVEELKEEREIVPLKEEVFIDQKHIDELDFI